MPQKILLILQFWEQDKAAAMKVARLVADLESEHSEQADFFFSARFDCINDPATVNYVSKKFNTFTYINNRRATGWPFGCNEQWFGSLDRVYTLIKAGKMPEYKALLFFEADAYPLVPDWIFKLNKEWNRLTALGACIVGAMIPPGPRESGGVHINGNCLISGDEETLFWLARKLGGTKPNAGWDFWLAPQFKKRGWANCPLIKSFWRAPTMTREFYQDLLNKGVVFCHGVKDSSVIQHVRETYLPGTLT